MMPRKAEQPPGAGGRSPEAIHEVSSLGSDNQKSNPSAHEMHSCPVACSVPCAYRCPVPLPVAITEAVNELLVGAR